MRNDEELLAVERYFDGEGGAAPESSRAEAHARYLERLREAAGVRSAAPCIEEPQFDAFMAGIREQVEQRPHGGRHLWAWASLAAASLVAASSLAFIFSSGPAPTAAGTEVIDYSTEVKGATVDVETTEHGATVWLHVTTEDLW